MDGGLEFDLGGLLQSGRQPLSELIWLCVVQCCIGGSAIGWGSNGLMADHLRSQAVRAVAYGGAWRKGKAWLFCFPRLKCPSMLCTDGWICHAMPLSNAVFCCVYTDRDP